jgi:methylated-DNA-[protein]-cysteine S-methyltransferase
MLAPRAALEADIASLVEIDSAAAAHPMSTQHLHQLSTEMAAYFEGVAEPFNVPLDMRLGSAWDRLVLEGVLGIAHGHVASYGEVAARIGRFGAARAVGGAVGRNPIAILVPCHRVIAAGGALGGYGGDWYGSREERLVMKRELLRLEGIVLRDDPLGARSDRKRAGEAHGARTPLIGAA